MINNVSKLLLCLLALIIMGCSDSKEGKSSLNNLSSKGHEVPLKGGERDTGRALYVQYCVSCHGEDGKKVLNGAKDLSILRKGREKIAKRIREGKGEMPSFNGILNEEEIQTIAAYVYDNIAD